MSINRSNYEIYFIDYLDGTLSESDKLAVEVFLAENPDLAAELDGDLPVLESTHAVFDKNALLQPVEWDEHEVTELYISQLELAKDDKKLSDSDQFRLAQFEKEYGQKCKALSNVITKTVLNPESIIELKERAKLGLLQLETDATHTELIAFLEGDLSAGEASALENKIASDATLASEVELLRKTYLSESEDRVVLPVAFKNDLKRKAGLVIPLWVKSAAASAAAVAAVLIMVNNNGVQETTAFTPRTSTYVDLSYDEVESSEESIFEENIASSESDDTTQQDLEKVEQGIINEDAIILYESVQPFVAESSAPKVNQEETAVITGEFSEPLIAMDAKSTNVQLPSSAEFTDGALINNLPEVAPQPEFNQLPVGDDLAENSKSENEALTPYEFIESKIKERFAPNPEEGTALAFVNKAAKKLRSSDDDLVAYEKKSESKKGFFFRLGKFSISRNK